MNQILKFNHYLLIDFVVWNPRTSYGYCRTTFTKGKRYYENGSWSFIFLLMWSFLLWAKNEGFHLKSYTFRLHFLPFHWPGKDLVTVFIGISNSWLSSPCTLPITSWGPCCQFHQPLFFMQLWQHLLPLGLAMIINGPTMKQPWFMFSYLLKVSYGNYLTYMFCLKVSRKNIMLTTISYLYD